MYAFLFLAGIYKCLTLASLTPALKVTTTARTITTTVPMTTPTEAAWTSTVPFYDVTLNAYDVTMDSSKDYQLSTVVPIDTQKYKVKWNSFPFDRLADICRGLETLFN